MRLWTIRWMAAAALASVCGAGGPAAAQPRPAPPAVSAYVEIADRTLGASVVVAGAVDRVDRIEDKVATGLAPGDRRYLVRVAVERALKAPGAVPAKLSFLWDARGTQRPDLLARPVIVFLVQQSLGEYRLVHADGMIAGDPAAEATVRAVIAEARDPTLALRRVTGVAGANWSPGTVPGAGVTQFFLQTAGGDPVSMIVTSRPGQPKAVSAAFSDAIDEAARPVARDTVPWFYLACGLPPSLPAAAVRGLDAPATQAARTDYQAAMQALGPCGLAPRSVQKEASSTDTPASG